MCLFLSSFCSSNQSHPSEGEPSVSLVLHISDSLDWNSNYRNKVNYWRVTWTLTSNIIFRQVSPKKGANTEPLNWISVCVCASAGRCAVWWNWAVMARAGTLIILCQQDYRRDGFKKRRGKMIQEIKEKEDAGVQSGRNQRIKVKKKEESLQKRNIWPVINFNSFSNLFTFWDTFLKLFFSDLIAVKYVSHIFKKTRLKRTVEGNRGRKGVEKWRQRERRQSRNLQIEMK